MEEEIEAPETCEGSKFHSPRPLVLQRWVIDPNYFVAVGEDERYFGPFQSILLCGICAANVRVYLNALVVSEGMLPWDERRKYGNLVRKIGDRAYTTYITLKQYEESLHG